MSITSKHLRLLLPLTLAACAVKINGKSYGPGAGGNNTPGSSSTSSSSGTAASDEGKRGVVAYAAPPSQCYEMGRDGDHPPILTSPADPWLAVRGDLPVAVKGAVRFQQSATCTAERDHCLRDCAWFLASREMDEPQDTTPAIYTGDDNIRSSHTVAISTNVIYRTVPATKRMLTKGAVVVALADGLQLPPDDNIVAWELGQLERVDWKAGQLYLVGSPNPYWLSAARVAVLSWHEGGKVQIVGKLGRDQLAVRKDELFAPMGEVVTTSDPWSQVKDGQPIVVEDRRPFAEVQGACKPHNDHCLRPWAWFVDTNNGYAYVGKFDGKTFQALDAVDAPTRLDGIVAAYRTVPATRDNLKVGTQVFWGGGTEKAAHTLRWDTGKVKKIRDDGKVDVARRSSNDTVPMDDVRVPVLIWMPGDKAEAL